jgi:hypothetical protein
MKLTFTTSLALLTAATASSTNGGGLRSRRLALFGTDEFTTDDSKAKGNANSDKKTDNASPNNNSSKNNDDASPNNNSSNNNSSKNNDDTSSKNNNSSKNNGKKDVGNGNVLGGSKKAKMEARFKKVEKARPASGISVSELYYYGDSIEGTITLTDDFISDAARESLNVTNLSEYSIHLYPYMGRPNCEGNDPVIEQKVDIADGGTDDPLNYQGTFTLSTSVDMKKSGTGYDLFLLDHTGCNVILGPEAVTVTMTPEEEALEEAAADKKAKNPNTALGRAQKAKAKVVSYKKDKPVIDNSKVTIKTKPALSADDYELTTDKSEYVLGEEITVAYSISTAPAAAEGRRLKQKEKITDEQVDELKQKEKITDEQVDEEPEPPTQPDPVALEFEEEDEEGEQQPDLVPTDLAVEEETQCDPADITKFKVGVFMKMAHPQGGKLQAVYEKPLCTSASCSAEEVSAGSIKIPSAELDTSKWGTGYDIWLLDCGGDGVAGPVFFGIVDEHDE